MSDDKGWIVELDNLGAFASIEELQALFDSIPDDEKKHPQARWLEGFIMGQLMHK